MNNEQVGQWAQSNSVPRGTVGTEGEWARSESDGHSEPR